MNSTAKAADRNVHARTAQVIPFRFEAREVRTILIGDQPWFVAADISAALEYRTAGDLARNLDDDEKGIHRMSTPGGAQEMLVINESGLYSAILRSRKAEAKRFKKWVTAEVLPAIRKHGRYEDSDDRMGTLVGQTIGTDGFHMLGALIKGKVSSLPVPVQRRATAKIWSQTHAAFGVRSAADIPANQIDAARNFIAAYALEGEWLPKEEKKAGGDCADFTIDWYSAQDVSHLLHHLDWVMLRWNQGIAEGVKALNPELYSSTFEHIREVRHTAQRLEGRVSGLVDYFKQRNGGLRPAECRTRGIAA
ncbi:BRO-N domain-containing protein [Metapseudomonas sp. CR1201]